MGNFCTGNHELLTEVTVFPKLGWYPAGLLFSWEKKGKTVISRSLRWPWLLRSSWWWLVFFSQAGKTSWDRRRLRRRTRR